MADYTVDDLKTAAKRAADDGNINVARSLIQKAQMLEAQQAATEAQAQPSMIEDVARALPAGVSRGVTETADFLQRYAPFMSAGLPLQIATSLFGERLPTAQKVEEQPLAFPMRETAAELTGGATEYRGRTIPAQYAGTIGEFAGGAAALPIGGVARSVGSAILPAIASETAGQLTAGTPYESTARLAAALGVPAAQAAATPLMRRAAIGPAEEVRGYMAGTQRPQSVELLRSMGVEDISAGQQLGAPQLMKLEGRAGPSLQAKQQLTQAALRQAGTQANLATPDVIKATRDRIGGVFDMADAMAGGVPTRAEGGRMVEALTNAEDAITVGKVPNKLKDIVTDFGEAAFEGNAIDPRNISSTRTKLNKAMSTYASENDMVNYELAYDLLEVLDDMVERQLRAVDPDFVSQLGQARQQYRSFLTIERALNRAGSDPASGIISPEALAGATRRREGVSYMRGTGTELAELARASQEVLSPLPAVSAGGVRDVGTLVQRATELVPSMAAKRMQETLPLPARQAITQRLLERLGRQTGGLLAID